MFQIKKQNKMPKISINVSEEEKKILMKRAKKNLLTLREQVEDIIRRSCLNFKKNSKIKDKVDDKLVRIFSRSRRGRRRKLL